ncbi:kinesin-domain-containing protein [Hesseltinella vesiculosa]|uniref:Kinesin-like protein unc-104 n=1 Tax=Hesseltinella vesiculosa TaxID=101127 RepID=A0A1X2GIM7_9FUNG|nr:kinesin-domain-containing protein [Hesseltinella vesiculosa]
MSGGNIKVVVRCRPLNSRELNRGATPLIEMKGNQTVISRPPDQRTGKDGEDHKSFTFDKSYWSADKNDPSYADQQTVYNDLGEELLDHAFDGYNCCIFAYGQTGSGKSYSMMGYGDDIGIIPRTCSELFNRIQQNTDPLVTYAAEVSYIEIYNEKVRDLLNPKNKGNLKVREHPSTGPYVEDLSRLVVRSFDDINHLMDEGNKARTVAATNMNETSSRSHAVFTVFLTQKRKDEVTKLESEKVARISLVDLAGSERANSTGATGARLKEGANINRSLTTLGKVIAGLAEQSTQKPGKKAKDNFIPYRDSVLTWLLKDSLGGNSKTAMIAAISPADYDETLSTLRYADQAKKIKNKAVVNEDPNAKMIRELKEELSLLRDRLLVYAPDVVEQLASNSMLKLDSAGQQPHTNQPVVDQHKAIEVIDSSGQKKTMTKMEMIDQLQTSEKLLANLNETWEEKLKRTETIQVERARALEELGITVHKDNVSLHAPKKMPHLVNLNEDPLMSECLVYQLKPGITLVSGKDHRPPGEDLPTSSLITLGGSNIQTDHCRFENKDGVVTLYPKEDALVMVNGMRISEPRELHSTYRIIMGDNHIFRFNHPEEVRRERELQQQQQRQLPPRPPKLQLAPTSQQEDPSSLLTPMSPEPATMDWNFARLEAVRNYYWKEGSFQGVNDDELEKLFDGVTRVRNSRRNTRCMSMISFDDTSTTLSTSTTADLHGIPSMPSTIPRPQSVLDNSIYEEKLMMEKERLQKELKDQKQFYEAKINRMSMQLTSGLPDLPDDPLQQHLPSIAATLDDAASQAAADDRLFLAEHCWTHQQRESLTRVVRRWQSMRQVAMAEVVLTHAALLKEANVISREMGKDTTYQFMVIEPSPFVRPRSALEPASTGHPWELSQPTFSHGTDHPLPHPDPATPHCLDDDDHDMRLAAMGARPCIGVRVLDRHHKSVYEWSLATFKTRLDRMKQLLAYRDQPVFQNMKRWGDADPFYDHPSPKYSFIGYAATSARNLVWQQPFESTVQVICRSTGQVKAHLRIFLSPVAPRVPVSSPASPSLHDEDTGGRLINQKTRKETIKVGQPLVFEVRLLDLSGLAAQEWSEVHVQFRLSSFGVPFGDDTGHPERWFVSDTVPVLSSTLVSLNYSQTFSITVTPDILHRLEHNLVHFELYGSAQPRLLDQYDRWDDQREKPRLEDLLATRRSSSSLPPSSPHLLAAPLTRKDDNEPTVPRSRMASNDSSLSPLVIEQHDVSAWIQIFELLPNGEYLPVHAVTEHRNDIGVFHLRQGLQRRISITLCHQSGRQFEWSRVIKATVGKIRLLDDKGRVIDAQQSSEELPIKLLSQKHHVSYQKDGTSQLVTQGAWDSSQHECLFLNRLTASRSRILLRLTWDVESPKCSKPIQFSMDVALRVISRDRGTPTGPSATYRFKRLLGASGSHATRYLTKCSGLFTVNLRPLMTRRASQLWRLNTANKPVPGEEQHLGSWRPRGVSLVNDYKQIQHRLVLKEQVELTSQVLTLVAARSQTSQDAITNEKRKNGTNARQRRQAASDANQHDNDLDETAKALLQKVLVLWQSKHGHANEIHLSQDPPIPGMQDLQEPQALANSGTKLLAEVKQAIQPQENIPKKGYLAYQEDPLDDRWSKRWCVLQSPYLYMYRHQNEQDELGVINLASSRIDSNKALEKLLKRHHVFSLYTKSNAYTLQAASKTDMLEWTHHLLQHS